MQLFWAGRGWSLSFDNAQIPLVPQNYSQAISHFKQESITGVANGQSIFTWDDSIGGFNASRFLYLIIRVSVF